MSWSHYQGKYPASMSIKELNEELYEGHYANRGQMDPVYMELHEIKGVASSYEEAVATANRYLSNKHGDSCCVKYKEKLCNSEKFEKIASQYVERANKEADKLLEYTKKHSVLLQKAAFIGCPHCKSKLAKEHLEDNVSRRDIVFNMHDDDGGRYADYRYVINQCPVCKNWLQNATVKADIEKRIEKITDLKTQFRAQIKELQTKGKEELFWYVDSSCYLG